MHNRIMDRAHAGAAHAPHRPYGRRPIAATLAMVLCLTCLPSAATADETHASVVNADASSASPSFVGGGSVGVNVKDPTIVAASSLEGETAEGNASDAADVPDTDAPETPSDPADGAAADGGSDAATSDGTGADADGESDASDPADEAASDADVKMKV